MPERTLLPSARNSILRVQTPRVVKRGKRSYSVAIDLTLIPDHGACDEEENEILRSAAKSGTTHFHGYATASSVPDHQREVLVLRFVEKGEGLETIVAWLLHRLTFMAISLRYA